MPRRQVPIPSGPYPTHGLLPKDETQAAAFIKRFPDYDGRGIRVAVLDTGVDPNAFGLNAKGKMVDIIDCTGSGDIPLKSVEPLTGKQADASKTRDAIQLPGISGRTLLVSPKWANPTSKWKVGYKRAFELWPKDLVKRRKEERKPEWDVKIASLLSDAKRNLDGFEKKSKEEENDKYKKDDSASAKKDHGKDKDDEKELDRKAKKADLEARLTYLNEFSLEDPGPVLDVVVFHDGKDWRAVVSGGEGDGEQNIAPEAEDKPSVLDLRSSKPMTDFRKEKHFERFGTQDLMSYSVNIVDEGEILSLAVVSGTHGTHVAAIIGGKVEDNPDLNGVAPGVEIVSLQIGDARLAGLETGQALMRATKAILDTECDICNMSFGEDAAWGLEDRGQFIAMLRDEVVKKRNVLFVAAAGNAGPALSTIGAPATTSGIISVGAFETPSMQAAEYALLENVPAGPYTWSSRGPTYDGAHVVTYAPGAAITGVPVYALQMSQLMNGTSMASPNACGAISLVLSALKAEGISYSPTRVIKAIQATSKDIDDPLNVGLIQVEALYKYLVDHRDNVDFDADFDVSIQRQGRAAPDFTKPLGQREGMRGIYLREPEETCRLFETTCFIKPSFASAKDTEKMYDLNLKLAMVATEPWVRTPGYLSLASAGRNFNIRVDPTALAPGLHFAEVRAYDTSTPGRSIFTVPVTVCKPERIATPSHQFKDWQTSPGHIERRYLAVPAGATWAELRFTTRAHASPVNLWVHCVQLQPEVRLSKAEQQFIISCTAGETITRKFGVAGGVTMELCSSQFWNSLPTADVSMEIHFHGISLDTGRQLTIVGGSALPRLQVTSQVRLEAFSPSISFDRVSSTIRPDESKVTPLGERDVMPDGKRLFQLVNKYTVKVSEKAKIRFTWPLTDNLYDAGFSVLTATLDERGQVVKFGTLYSDDIDLKKGEYTILLQAESSDYKALERNKSMQMTVQATLAEKTKKLSLNMHRDHIDALCSADSTAYKNIKLPLGETRPLVINTELNGETEDLYKVAKAGDTLLGQLKLGPGSAKADYDLTYVLPPQAKAKDDSDGSEDKEKPLLEDLQLSILEKIQDDEEKTAYLDKLISSSPKHLPLLLAKLKSLKENAASSDVQKAADAVLAQIDESRLSSYLGKKAVPISEQTKEDKKTKKEMDQQKTAWISAYGQKIEASYNAKESILLQRQLFTKYRQFVDGDKDKDFWLASAKRDMDRQLHGSALQTLGKLISEAPAKDKYKEIVSLRDECLGKLGWTVITEYEQRWKLVKEPPQELVW